MILNPKFYLNLTSDTFFALITAWRRATNDDERKWIQSTIDHAIRQLEKFVSPEVSVKAQEHATAMKIGSLHIFKWADQKLKMKDKERNIFHWEHVLPVSDARRRLLHPQTITIGDVEDILLKFDIAWILKSENEELDKKHRAKRDMNPWDTYNKIGIDMVKRN